MKVLIVDDSVVMRTIIERGLKQAGVDDLQVRHAANGVEALAELELAQAPGAGFDLILTDVHMPVMGGPDLITEAHRRGLAQGVPVVLVTAQTEARESADVPDCQRLVKPFTLEQMRSSLGSLLHTPLHG